MAQPDTTPLRIGKKSKTALHDVETSDLAEHFKIHSAGLYASHQYADLSLILKGRRMS